MNSEQDANQTKNYAKGDKPVAMDSGYKLMLPTSPSLYMQKAKEL